MELQARIDRLALSSQLQTGLAPIYGGGANDRPDRALVFINPTYRNISSRPGWDGPRFPFIGTSRVWRFLSEVGWLDRVLVSGLPTSPDGWSVTDAQTLEGALLEAGLYLTNVVKATAADSQLPSPAVVADYRQLLLEELQVVRPRLTIAFGAIAYRALTGQTIRLADAYSQSLAGQPVITTGDLGLPVLPCYFPVGRGNPRRARQMLLQLGL